MNKLKYLLFLLVTIVFFSCETDIDVNAEYKDIPVVYGLIDPQDSVHYIKINKAFLGNANALDLAADANNFNYAAGELDVIVEEWNETAKIQSYSLVRTVNEIPKDPGIFDNSENVLYRFVETAIDRDNTYKLKIVNSSLSKETTAETKIVGSSTLAFPGNQNKLQFHNGVDFLTPPDFLVNAGTEVGRVELTLVFHYNDYFTTSSLLPPVPHSISIPLGESITGTVNGKQLDWSLKGEIFFDKIFGSTPAPSTLPFFSHREVGNFTLEIDVAGSELSTFMSVSTPSTSVNQDKPPYTNIIDGLGIFSSREKMIWNSTILPSSGNINLQTATIQYLSTAGLGFCFGNSPTSGHKCNQLP